SAMPALSWPMMTSVVPLAGTNRLLDFDWAATGRSATAAASPRANNQMQHFMMASWKWRRLRRASTLPELPALVDRRLLSDGRLLHFDEPIEPKMAPGLHRISSPSYRQATGEKNG